MPSVPKIMLGLGQVLTKNLSLLEHQWLSIETPA